MKVGRDNVTIRITGENGGYITSQSVEAVLLYQILMILNDPKKNRPTQHAPDLGKARAKKALSKSKKSTVK